MELKEGDLGQQTVQKVQRCHERVGLIGDQELRHNIHNRRFHGEGLNRIGLAAAKEAGSEWVVVEQDAPSMGLSAMESIKKSVEYLKSFEW